jgi:hypothetical protein
MSTYSSIASGVGSAGCRVKEPVELAEMGSTLHNPAGCFEQRCNRPEDSRRR